MRIAGVLFLAAALVGVGGCGPDGPGVEDVPQLPVIDSLWDYNEPQESEARFRDLLPRARESGQTDYVVELLTQIGRAQGLQQDFAGATETLDEAAALLSDDMK